VTAYALQLARAAEGDIAEAFVWYRERNALAADAFRAEVFDAFERIVEVPLHRAADEEGNRRFVLKRFPYSVVYEVSGMTVTVLAVAHHRRKPAYWRTTQLRS
jgi:plasmid stabilization system protein ParE